AEGVAVRRGDVREGLARRIEAVDVAVEVPHVHELRPRGAAVAAADVGPAPAADLAARAHHAHAAVEHVAAAVRGHAAVEALLGAGHGDARGRPADAVLRVRAAAAHLVRGARAAVERVAAAVALHAAVEALLGAGHRHADAGAADVRVLRAARLARG